MMFIVRFSPLLYPTVGGFVGKDSGGQKLITDFCQASRSHNNCALISNGSIAKACKDQRVLLCSSRRKYHHCLEGAQADAYCVTTNIGDKKILEDPRTLERNCDDVIAHNAIQGALVPQELSSKNWTRTAFHLVCGVKDNNHRGHPPMAPHEITNCTCFLDAPTLENAAAMAAANIPPSQAALFTRSSTGELFTRG
ncbi:hypothetical protein MHU86_18320 [Fragilaria crotonensis]|nr:hypothetical protein MHU86_18320 [Fragilaria crotonensis]